MIFKERVITEGLDKFQTMLTGIFTPEELWDGASEGVLAWDEENEMWVEIYPATK